MPFRFRLLAVLLLAGSLPALAQPAEAPWPTEGWATASPEEQGLNPEPFAALDRAIAEGVHGYIDRMVVVRNGWLVVDERYTNDYQTISQGHAGVLGCGAETCPDEAAVHDFNYLHPDRHPYYQGRDVHSLQSITKSVTSALVGVAIGRGDIDGVAAPLLPFFEDYDLAGIDERLQAATLEDLLTMRSGIEWHETDRPLDTTNTTLQLERSHDWIQFTLNQPMDAAPGEKWVYNSGGSHLMSGLLRSATGHPADAYAEAHLFGPLGIRDYHWKKTPQGLPDTEGGLYLAAEDLAKIGLLFLRNGLWDGRRLLPEGWVAASTARQVERVNGAGWGYGYQWWRLDRDGTEVWAGLGFGGQYLLILPAYDLVGVVNSWNLFGGRPAPLLPAFLDALIAAAEHEE